MKNTAIIIPARLGAKRFRNKPLVKINGIPMIIHVLNRAKESRVGKVFVATPDSEIIDIVKENGGQAILTKHDHPSGSDRVYEAYLKQLKDNVNLIINLQGDMPNIKPNSISKAKDFFRIKKDLKNEKIYHHIGIYAFTIVALTKYVKLSRSKFEIKRHLEQMRAMENNLVVKVGLSDSIPLGVDTKEDLKKVTKEMS
jgi:3-deoxy-manno-octulosonate cytidylyltransferase (CMP-KDO synthetase)